MQFVAKDKGGDWCFDGVETYWCRDKANKPVGKIYGRHLPDPYELWRTKCREAEVTEQSFKGRMLRPNKVIFELWEHWRNHAEPNNES